MKDREIFSALRTTAPCFIRLDGRSFRSTARALSLQKPFDQRLAGAMEAVASLLLGRSGLSFQVAYTFSDEINLFLRTLPFEGRIEKLDSVAASYAASALTLELGLSDPISFDARIIPVSNDIAVEYLIWRQKEAWRNHNNAYCQWALGEEGYSPTEVQERLHRMNTPAMHEIMYSRGINLAETPAWQRRGVIVCRREEEYQGYNPVTEEETMTIRSRIVPDRNPPIFHTEEGRKYLSSLLI